jgi:hypothetical protein
MTILDATTHLFEWFKTHDSFEEKNVKDVILISDTPERDKAAFLCCLDELVLNEVLGVTEIKERKIWVLKKNLQAYDQSVDVPYPLALEVAGCIHRMCDVLGDYSDEADPKALSTKDIMNLTFICKTLQGPPPDSLEEPPPEVSL